MDKEHIRSLGLFLRANRFWFKVEGIMAMATWIDCDEQTTDFNKGDWFKLIEGRPSPTYDITKE